METGTKISIGMHGILLGLAAFGGPLFDSDESKAIQISEVSIITSAEFDGLMSSAPSPQLDEPSQSTPSPLEEPSETVEAPQVEQTVEEPPVQEAQTPPETDAPPDAPDLAEAAEPDIPPEPVVESSETADQAQEATGNTVVTPDAQLSETDTSGQVSPDQLALLRPKPRPAPRIDNKVSPEPPTDAQTGAEAVESTTPSDEAAEPEETKEEVAPKESTTEIVTEAEQDPNSAAPVKSARPKGRPSDIVARAQAAKDAARKAAEQEQAKQAAADKAAADQAAKDAQARAIEEAVKAAAAEAAAESAARPSGPPLTGREKGALVLAVQQCWAPPVGVQGAADLVVTLSVELSQDGKLVGNPKLIEPSGTPQGLVQQAYEAGRRALIRCAPYNLPQDKYEQWRQLEVVFNPQNMAVR
ncbi:hypothetical protein [Neptunicoccus sediminis]|uniref:hypothetical protein n=1 Tax=Neptunicoccus sediminis TaxID=1892596 RepID=UPI000845F508|nr:hypothetical protein [Neptunicoccus sediminis]